MSTLIVPPNFIGTLGPDDIKAMTTDFNSVAIQVNDDGIINTRGGSDTIYAYAGGDTSYGINDDGSIVLGSGNDQLTAEGSYAGLQVNGILDAGVGSDSVWGGGNSIGFSHNAYGVQVSVDGRLSTGPENDVISAQAYGNVPGNVSEGLMVVGVVSTGNGDDGISGWGINDQGHGIGIRTWESGSINTGPGDDNVFGWGTECGIAADVHGGSGSDHFVARRIDYFDLEVADQGGAVDGARLFGDEGDDLFDVGYGNATLNGGAGNDTLLLRGTPEDYTLERSNNGDLTVLRDGYTMSAVNFEAIEYYSAWWADADVGQGASTSGAADFLSEAMLR